MAKTEYNARRAVLLGAAALVAMPLAMPAMAAAIPSPDADLVQTCEAAVALYERTTDPAWDDDAASEILDQAYALMAIAIATPAATQEGLKAKARLLRIEDLLTEGEDEARLGPSERLMRSLVNDLIRQDRRVPTLG